MKRKPTHPGAVFKYDVLEPLNLTITEASLKLGISRKALSSLVNEKVSLSSEMAKRIAKATNTTIESWIGMQSKLDIWNAENDDDIDIEPFLAQG